MPLIYEFISAYRSEWEYNICDMSLLIGSIRASKSKPREKYIFAVKMLRLLSQQRQYPTFLKTSEKSGSVLQYFCERYCPRYHYTGVRADTT